MFVHVELLGEDCHWYVVTPTPPLAGVDVKALGVAPEAIEVLVLLIVPALNAKLTVIFTTLLYTVPHEGLVSLRR